MLDEMERTRCQGTNAEGRPCAAQTVTDGWCCAHRPGGADFMREIGVRGGAALRAKLAGQAFEPAELPPIESLEDAKLALDAIRIAVLCRRITHAEGNAAAKAIDSWVKTETAAITARLVNELRAELESKSQEIDALKRQLTKGHAVRMAR